MLHPTLAPDFTGSGTITLQVTKSTAYPRGKHWSKAEGFPVIIIEAACRPTMVITEDGNARLVRRHDGQQFNEKHVYTSKKTFHVATPFTQPLHVLILAYDKATGYA